MTNKGWVIINIAPFSFKLGNLESLIEKCKKGRSTLDEHRILSYCNDILEALKYLHGLGIIHENINPR